MFGTEILRQPVGVSLGVPSLDGVRQEISLRFSVVSLLQRRGVSFDGYSDGVGQEVSLNCSVVSLLQRLEVSFDGYRANYSCNSSSC